MDQTPSRSDFPIAIVGAGFSGLGMGIMLKEAGFEGFTIFEKADDLGGTWRDNTYPGAACDIPSHLYSYSFEPKTDWSRAYPRQSEIHQYLHHCAEKYGLEPHIRYGARVVGATFSEASGTWTLRFEDGDSAEARAVVLGNGALHLPALPEFPGLESFEGHSFHTSRWDHDYDLSGKRVAVIGTGASAIQIVPEIAPQVAELHLFQRTPPWVLPKPDRPMRRWEKWMFRHIPGVQRLYRSYLYWLHETRAVGFVVDQRLMYLFEKLARKYLEDQVADPGLRAKVTPDYTIGCKRVLISNDYYRALSRPDVELIDSPLARVHPDGAESEDGRRREVDAIIYATGFTATDYLAPLDIRGRGGRVLNDMLQESPAHYLGITIRHFPNLFLLMGPNTGLGHNSMIFMIEAQARYTLQAIEALYERNLAYLDVDEEVQAGFHQHVQEKLGHTVWASGCSSWYLKDGVNNTLWPDFTFKYWWRTRKLRLEEYEKAPLGAPQPVS